MNKILSFLASLFVRRLPYNQAVPDYYAIAWQDPLNAHIVVMPFGLNVVAAWARRRVLWVRYFGVKPVSDMPAYHAGVVMGRRSAAQEFRNAFAILMRDVTVYRDAMDFVMREAERHGAVVTAESHPEAWADASHARMRLERAVRNARHQLRALRANCVD